MSERGEGLKVSHLTGVLAGSHQNDWQRLFILEIYSSYSLLTSSVDFFTLSYNLHSINLPSSEARL